MSKDPKKIAAAAMGVIRYLKAEEERSFREQENGPEASFPPGERPVLQSSGSLWAASGRMEIMRFRNLMERRVFRRGG